MRVGIAIAALALAVQAGCGGDDLEGSIPQQNAEALLKQLDGLQQAVESGNCTTAETDATQFVEAVNALPEESGAELKGSLREAGQNLDQLIASDCVESGATGEGEVQPTTTPTTTTVAPVEPAPAPEEEAPPEQPPGEGQGQGPPPSAGGEDEGSGGIGEEKGKGQAKAEHEGKG